MSINKDLINIDAIAIIGMSCRFPEAENTDQFWENLQQGRESITSFSKEELRESGVPHSLYNSKDYVNRACIIDNIEMFDASFFGYSIEEAELMDPQQRLLIECAYEALEDAGYTSQDHNITIGMFGGVRGGGYAKLLDPVLSQVGTLKYFKALLGTAVDQACMRVSYTLDIRGPSIGVQTVCSTSLVATHLACESLKNGECDMALVGAASMFIPQKQGYLYDKEMVASPDGHCRAFDINAKGTMGGNGTGVILLKRFEQAYDDNDNIYAIIRGSAINNDGAAKAGYRVPSVEGQAKVIQEALNMAETDPETIDYVETNGTGTLIGDMIEVESLERALRKQPGQSKNCKIGSVKTNIGHLTQAAGMAGLIKTVLSLKNKKLPPSLNFKTPNPNLEKSCFQVNTHLCNWEQNDHPRRAGVSAFAIGGTNAHLILEQAEERIHNNAKEPLTDHLLTISAKSETALKNLIKKYLKFLKNNPQAGLEEICYTSNIGRNHYPYRIAILGDSNDSLHLQLSDELNKRQNLENTPNPNENTTRLKICFAFSGNILKDTNHIEKIYNRFDSFKKIINSCDLFVQENYNFSILSTLSNEISLDLNHQACCAAFALEYAFAETLISWGIKPLMVTGNKTGEYTAACVAGMFDYKDAIKLIVSSTIKQEHENEKTIIHNIEKIDINTPEVKILLFDQHEKLTHSQIPNPSYWLNNKIINNKRSNDLVKIFQKDDINCIIEPERIIYRLPENDFGRPEGGSCMVNTATTDNAPKAFPGRLYDKDKISPLFIEFKEQRNCRNLLKCVAWLYDHGVDINWKTFHIKSNCKRISLPTYAFERTRCWFDG